MESGTVHFLQFPWGGGVLLRISNFFGQLTWIALERRGRSFDFTSNGYQVGDRIVVPSRLPTLTRKEKEYIDSVLSELDADQFEGFE